MESVILLGCFIAIALGGFFLMGKIDKFTTHMQEDTKKRRQAYILQIATSDLYVAYYISDFLSDMLEQYPDLQYTLLVGQEEELLHYFDKNKTDVIIVSSNIE